jgi:hypothetical protein
MSSSAGRQGLIPGTPVILPSSFLGSPRNMQQNYQDAMAIVRKYGKPDLFITMTCNPKWKEITENLNPWDKAEFRPDLIARVFHLKLDALLDDLCKKEIFGPVAAIIHVIEFQKRGLPHAHILLILQQSAKLKDVEAIDQVVCAEIPNPETHPRLFEVVTKHMIHGPCKDKTKYSPCMEDGVCQKGFPKEFNVETLANSNGYPIYRRLETPPITVNNKTIDNSWVVPYNPYLSLKYNCHINVEVCASVQSVKYLFKYVYKGHDSATVDIASKDSGVLEHNEIKSYLDTRYVSAPEGIWRIFGFPMHKQSHTIIRLGVHLPEQQNVFFVAEAVKKCVQASEHKDSTLTAWFKLNRSNPEARQYLYGEIPEHYTFHDSNHTWQPRLRGAEKVIGRMYCVNMHDTERYFLRMLLLYVPGALSFEDIRTVNGVEHDTFLLAAKAMGLVESDDVWNDTLIDAAVASMPKQLRELFGFICLFCLPTTAPELWNNHKKSLMEDYAHAHVGHQDDCIDCENLALRDVQETLSTQGKTLDNFGLRTPPANLPRTIVQLYDQRAEKLRGEQRVTSLNAEQRAAFDEIMNAVYNRAPQYCFLARSRAYGPVLSVRLSGSTITLFKLNISI